MADDRPAKRQQTQTERDLDGLAARRERARSAPFGVPVTFDEVTGNYEGEELAQMRARRPTDMRLRILEQKQDDDRADHKALVAKVDQIHVDVAGMRGELSVLPKLLDLLEGKEQTKRLGISTRGKIIIAALGVASTVLAAVVASMAGCA